MEKYLGVFCVIFLLFALFGKAYCKNWANPITLFCGVWTAVLFAYSLHLFKLYTASELTVTICIVGVFSFFIGAMLRAVLYRKFKSSIETKDNFLRNRVNIASVNIVTSSRINYKLLFALNCLSLALFMPFAIMTLKLLMSGHGFDYIRDMYMDEDGGSLGGSKLTAYIMSFFLWPWNYVIIPLTVIAFVVDKSHSKIKRLFLYTSVANVLIFVIVTAGRVSMVYCAMYFVLVCLLMGKRLRLTKSQKYIILATIVLIVVGISVISASRGSPAFLQNAYVYICGCMPFASNRLKIYYSQSGVKTLGFASFRGVWMILMIPLSKIIGYPDLYLEAVENIYVQDRIYIAPHQGYNAFTSLFYYFFIDGGMLGVVILSAIYGCISMDSYIRMLKNRDYKSLLVYCIVAFGLIFSMVRFQFATMRYVGAFVYIWVCFHKTRLNHKGRSTMSSR